MNRFWPQPFGGRRSRCERGVRKEIEEAKRKCSHLGRTFLGRTKYERTWTVNDQIRFFDSVRTWMNDQIGICENCSWTSFQTNEWWTICSRRWTIEMKLGKPCSWTMFMNNRSWMNIQRPMFVQCSFVRAASCLLLVSTSSSVHVSCPRRISRLSTSNIQRISFFLFYHIHFHAPWSLSIFVTY